ncbi:autotransporter outer membrane beta-barrel domain-containing protein [Salmonella enterica subsp. salamae]|nr:autotransporter outer membrane beta-barrel domain-containing protein [Salmonella enterica subsp. salamae]ECJ2281140.1 autotransporter outer membrane beta-barrel domain-containing protein [Salmonella enterica subsp. salamae]
MNKNYSIVWNAVRNRYVVASELAHGDSKVKTQVCVNQIIPGSTLLSESVPVLRATRNLLACAIIIAFGFSSSAALATNTVEYTDATSHTLDKNNITYSDPTAGSALYVEGQPSIRGGWIPTTVTGTGVVIEASGGGAIVPGNMGGTQQAHAVTLNYGAELALTDSQIIANGQHTAAVILDYQSSVTLTGSLVQSKGAYSIFTIDRGSEATLSGTRVEETTDTNTDIVAQNNSILNLMNGSEIVLTAGQVRIVDGATLNMSDSFASSGGAESTLYGYKNSTFTITGSTITHTNTDGAAVEINSGSTLTMSGDKVISGGTGVYGIASAVNIDGTTIKADGDGIMLTSQNRNSFYDDIGGLIVKKSNVTSKSTALHVDSNTTLKSPVKLTDSAFSAPTVVKLESKTAIEADNSQFTGDVLVYKDESLGASSLSLANKSTLTGSVQGNVNLSLDDTSHWVMAGDSQIGALENNGIIDFANQNGATGTLGVSDLNLAGGSQLNIAVASVDDAPAITSTGEVHLDGTLNIDSTLAFAETDSDHDLQSVTLIDAQTEITGDFATVSLDSIDTSMLPDYLTVNGGIDVSDKTHYVLSEGLTWYASAHSTKEAHGTFTVDDQFEVTRELDKVAANAIWDGETLTKEGDGTLILSNANNDYGATQVNGGTLVAKDAAALGTGEVALAGGTTLALEQGTLDNDVTGKGRVTKGGSGELIVNGDNDYSGGTTISAGTLTANNADSLGTGGIANSGVLQVAYGELDNVISGAGSLVKNGDGALTLRGDNSYAGGTTISAGTLTAASLTALGSGDIDNAGTLVLDGNGAFNLAGASIVTHDGGTLSLAVESTLNTQQLIQEDGGTLSIALGETASAPVITADDVTLDGTLDITGIDNIKSPLTNDPYTFTLIDSVNDIQGDFDDLAIAGMEQKTVDFMTIDGKINDEDRSRYDMTASLSWYADRDKAATDAHGTFTLSNADGSFTLGADLADVDDSLNPASTTGWDGKTLTKEGEGRLILTGNNDYTGGTVINEGTLMAGSEYALGKGRVDNFASLMLDADGKINVEGGITTHTDAVTGLALGSSLALGGGTLTQESGSMLNVEIDSHSVQPLITGNGASLGGELKVNDVTLSQYTSDTELQSFKLMDMDSDISGDFTRLTMNIADQPDYLTVSGMINPEDGSEYLLTEGLSWNAAATSATAAHGTFTLGAGDSFDVTTVLADKTGNADWDGKTLTKQGAGKLTLSGANTYSGDTHVENGTLWLTGTGVIGVQDSQQAVNVASDAAFGGANGAVVNGNVNNKGTLTFGDSEETGAVFTLNGDLMNMGTLASGSNSRTPGNTLYVDGDYTGNGGSLYLNTVLGNDDSATDKLVITGDASGETGLYINGIGEGAQTVKGIEVVDVGGVSSSDAFELKNQVQAGLYEYRLYRDESTSDWYLASKAKEDGGDVTPQYRADIGAYMGNQWMVRNLQMQTLYDREGSQYHSADGSVWARFKAGNAESEAVSGNIDMDSNYSQFQLGGDVLAWNNGAQSFTVGVMASYINADTDSTGNRGADGSQFTAKGSVDGYNLGVYATWFADAQTHSGVYVDNWYQYGIYNNSADNGDVGAESYDSTANAVSLETGYRYDIAPGNGNGNSVSLTPQAQVVWQNYKADSVTDNNGTRIDDQNGDSWTTRLGLRVDGKLYKGKTTVIQPFVEANWLHASDDVTVSFDGARVEQDIPANRAELKVGLQANIDKQWSIRAQVAGQTGSNDYGDLNGSLNLRYAW